MGIIITGIVLWIGLVVWLTLETRELPKDGSGFILSILCFFIFLGIPLAIAKNKESLEYIETESVFLEDAFLETEEFDLIKIFNSSSNTTVYQFSIEGDEEVYFIDSAYVEIRENGLESKPFVQYTYIIVDKSFSRFGSKEVYKAEFVLPEDYILNTYEK